MPENRQLPTLKEVAARVLPIMRAVGEDAALVLLRSVPLVGSALVMDRKSLRRLSTLFESDSDIQRDIDKVVENMEETEVIMSKLKVHIENRKNDLQQTLDEYKRFKDLASVEREKALPLINELRREGNKGIWVGLVINVAMIVLGIILNHYLREWFPGFTF